MGALLCQAIKNADDEIVAVAQVLNKTGSGTVFGKDDEKVGDTMDASL